MRRMRSGLMHRASGRLRPTSRRTQPHPVRSRPISSSANRAHVRAGKSPMGRRRPSASLVRRERPSPDHREHRGMDAFDAGERGDEAERTGERRLEIEGTGSMTLHPETVPDAGRPTSAFRSEMDPNGSGATAARRPWYGSPCPHDATAVRSRRASAQWNVGCVRCGDTGRSIPPAAVPANCCGRSGTGPYGPDDR